MPAAQRFFVNEDSYIVDMLRGTSDVHWWDHYGPKDEKKLRELVLSCRLHELVKELINPNEKDDYDGEWGEYLDIANALDETICASRLNELDVALSLQARFDGKLKRKQIGTQDHTSLSLFCDDVERLLRDFYGETDDQAIDKLLRAVFLIVKGFTRHVRHDLWQEHKDAMDWDYGFGIGMPDGDAIHSSDYWRARKAYHNLALRVLDIRNYPAGFSKYTIAFVKWMGENWSIPKSWDTNSSSNADQLSMETTFKNSKMA